MQEYPNDSLIETTEANMLGEPETTYMAQQRGNSAPGYVDVMNDWAFKKIFGSEESKGILISFLNEVLKGKREISTINYSKNEYQGESNKIATAIIDIACTDPQGNNFLIEVQKSKQRFFKDRTLFYASRFISSQAPKGSKRVKWNYQLKDVYVISILEHFVLDPGEAPGYYHQVSLVNNTTGKLFYDKLGFTYIELLKFGKTEKELSTDLDKWLYAIKHMKTLNSKPTSFANPEFEKLFNLANFANLTKEEMDMYYESQKVRWDNQNALDFAEETGIEKGRAEGKHNKAIEMAVKLKAKSMSIEEIAELTSLSIEEIRTL